MGLFDFLKKKPKAEESPAAETPAPVEEVQAVADNVIDDITFIKAMKHVECGRWQQYDVLFAARPYGWDAMINWADYMASADLENVSQVTAGYLGGQEKNLTNSYLEHGGSCAQMPELQQEQGMLSVAGNSKALNAPTKIVWVNQTRAIRIFTFINNEDLLTRYVETAVRRTFGTADAMKRAKPIPQEPQGDNTND